MKACLACGTAFASDGWVCPHCGWSPDGDGVLRFAPELAEQSDGFDPRHYAALAALEEAHFWFRSRNRLLVWALETYFPGARKLLEIGCGTGFVLAGIRERFPDASLTGSEVLAAGLDTARERVPDAQFLQMDARAIPFEDEYDVVCAFDVVEHIEEDELVLRQMERAARRGGGILLTVPQHPSLWSAADEAGHHKRRYTRKELVRKVEDAGLQIVRVTSFASFTLPLMALSRLRRRRLVEGYDPAEELRLGRHANRALELVLGAERPLIRRGVSLPAGGSLLLAARRRS